MPYVPLTLRAVVSYVPRVLRALVPYVSSCLTCSCVPHVSCALHVLGLLVRGALLALVLLVAHLLQVSQA